MRANDHDGGRTPTFVHRLVERAPASLTPLLLVAAWTLFAIVWIWTNPLGSAPDESDHYIRAVAAGHGHLLGTPAPALPPDPQTAVGRRNFPIPVGMAAESTWACDAFHPDQSAACANGPEAVTQGPLAQTAAGTYMPTAYIVPGVLIRLASTPDTALRLGRLGSALLSLSLLATAVWLLWSRRRSAFALLGVMLAVTPMQLFLLSELGPNGLEPAAAICFAAGVLRLARPAPVSRWHWLAFAYGGVLLAATRPLGPLWLVGGGIVALLLVSPARIGHRLRELPWVAAASCGAMVAAAVINVWWQSRYPSTVHVAPGAFARAFWDGVDQVPRLLGEMVGDFGWLDTLLPTPLLLAWLVAVVFMGSLALLVGTARQRLAVVLLALATVLLGAAITTYLSLDFGYAGGGVGVQGRYLMPLALWFPLVCGEVIHLRRDRLGQLDPHRLVLYVAALTALVQLGAMVVNARRYAVGASGPIFFLPQTLWRPPAGWALWTVLAVAATALAIGSGGLALRVAATAARNPREPAVKLLD